MKAILGWLIFCAQKIGCKIRKNDWKGDKRAEWGKCSFQKSGFKIRILFLLKTIFINTHCENIKLDFGLVVQSLVPSHAPWNPFNYPVLNPESHPFYTNLMQRPHVHQWNLDILESRCDFWLFWIFLILT